MKKRYMTAFTSIALTVTIVFPVSAFASGVATWDISYGYTKNGSHVQQTADLNTKGSSPRSSSNSSSSSSNNDGKNSSNKNTTPGSMTPPKYWETELQIGIQKGLDDAKAAAAENQGNTGISGSIIQTIKDSGVIGGNSDPSQSLYIQSSSSWKSSTSDQTLFSFVPRYWDWKFSNSDFPATGFSRSHGPIGSMSQMFNQSGYWHVDYRIFGTFTYGHFEKTTITVTSMYQGKTTTKTYTYSTPVVDRVFDDYNGGWNHLTDFRLNDWELCKPWSVPDVGQRQVEIGVTTSQVVAR
jgi:hypothetical protein